MLGEQSGANESRARESLGRTILRNSLLVSSGGGLIRLLSFAYTIYYVRVLGETVYGQYAIALAFGGLFSIFFELGTTQYVERSLAQDRARLPELLGMLIVVRLALGVIGVAALPALALALGYERIIVLCIAVGSSTIILAAVLAPLQAILTSHERYDLWTASQLIGQLGTIVCGLAVLWLGGGLVWLMAIGLIVMPAQIAYCLAVIRRNGIGPLRFAFDPARVRGFLRVSLPFALTSLALTISFNVDTFLLSLLQTHSVVGWYSAAYRLVPTVVSILGGFLTVITPSLARTYLSDREAVHRWTRTSIKWLAMFGLPAAMGMSLLAGQITGLLYGPSFAPAAAVLALIAWDIPLRLFNAFAGNVTAAVGLERPGWRTFMSGTLVGVILYPPAIMAFGMLGAAAVTVLSDGVTAVRFYRLLGRHLQAGLAGPTLLMVAGATALMGVIVWVSSELTVLPVTVALGVVSFTGFAVALRLIDQAMLVRVAALLRKGGPRS